MRFVIPAAGGREELVIEAPAAENLNYFLNTPLTPATSAGVVTKQVTVKSYQRRSFPGDANPSTVAASAREFMYDAGMKSGNALGGYTFALVSDAGLPAEEKRQFTLVRGRMMDLHSFLASDAKMQIYLYGRSGARYVIDGTTP